MSINWTELNFENNIIYQGDELDVSGSYLNDNLSFLTTEDDENMLQFGNEILELFTNTINVKQEQFHQS